MGLCLLTFGIFLFLLIFGVPLAFSMAAAGGIVLAIGDTVPAIGAVSRAFNGIDSITLLAIPFFILSGSLMEGGSISEQLVNFSKAFVGHFKAGLAYVCVLSCMIFAAVSGSSMATALAFGNILAPAMKEDGYDVGFIATLQATGGTLGPIIPPSLLFIMYASSAGLSIGSLFMSGLVPGILMGIALMIVSYFQIRKTNVKSSPRMPWNQRIKVIVKAIPALLMPIIIIGGTLAGFCSPSEAGMVACVYAIAIGFFLYKGLKIRDLPRIFAKGAMSSGMVLILMALANVMGYVLTRLDFATKIGTFLSSFVTSGTGCLVVITIFLLILGMFMDSNAALVIFAPVFYPLAFVFDIDPLQLGLIVVMCQVVAQITPPVGVLLSTTAAMNGIPMQRTFKHLVPQLIALVVVLIICIFVPQLGTWLPHLIYG